MRRFSTCVSIVLSFLYNHHRSPEAITTQKVVKFLQSYPWINSIFRENRIPHQLHPRLADCPTWRWYWSRSLSVRSFYFYLKRINPNQQVLMKGRLIKWAKCTWTDVTYPVYAFRKSEVLTPEIGFRHYYYSTRVDELHNTSKFQQYTDIDNTTESTSSLTVEAPRDGSSGRHPTLPHPSKIVGFSRFS